MKRLLVLLFLAVASVAWCAKFETLQFDTRYTINRDGSVDAEEQIVVRFTERQRGLVRRLPAVTRGRDGARRRVRYELGGVTRDGDAEPARDSLEGGDWQVRIGSADRYLTGRAAYTVRYRILGALTPQSSGALGPRNEFFWNVLPTDWATDIAQGSVVVGFPQVTDPRLRARVLVGRGDRKGLELAPGRVIGNSTVVSASMSDTELRANLVRPLLRGQTMTVVLALPEDTVQAPPPDIAYVREKPPFELKWSWLGFGIPFAGLLPLWLWRSKRTAREGPLVVQFDPPEGIGAAECGKLLDGVFQPRDVVAGILSIAQKGAAKVRPHASEVGTFSVRLETVARGERLTDFEQGLYQVLEPFGPNIDAATLRGEFGREFQRLRTNLDQVFQNEQIVAPTGGCGVGCFFVAGSFVLASFLSNWLGVAVFVGAVVASIVALILVATMNGYTRHGAKVRGHARGLREFIKRANADELRHMSRTMPAQALYERLLPFAVAFGLAEQWARAFDGLDLMAPEWFESPYGSNMWTAYQVGHLLAHDNSWEHSVAPPVPDWANTPSSYNSGGGFSSGDSGFGSTSGDFGSSYDSSSGSFDSGGSAGDGGGGGGGDSW